MKIGNTWQINRMCQDGIIRIPEVVPESRFIELLDSTTPNICDYRRMTNLRAEGKKRAIGNYAGPLIVVCEKVIANQ